jgi:hypothetical protein
MARMTSGYFFASSTAVAICRWFQRKIVVDLLRADSGGRDHRILVAAKRRIGHAVKLAARGQWRCRQPHRCAEPPPHDADCERSERKMRKRRADGIAVRGAKHGFGLTPAAADAKRARANCRARWTKALS